MGPSATFRVKQTTLISKSALEPLAGRVGCAQNKPHPRKVGAVVNLRTTQAGHCVLNVADFVKGMPRYPPREKLECMMPPRSATCATGHDIQQSLGDEMFVYGAEYFSFLQRCFVGKLN